MRSRGAAKVEKALKGLDRMILRLGAAAEVCLQEQVGLQREIDSLELCREETGAAMAKAQNAHKGFTAILEGRVQ